jgi:hypothetical protein
MKSFIPNEPIYIGFAGPAGSGKTSTANYIVPKSTGSAYGQIETSTSDIWGNITVEQFPDVIWDHFYFALPLYDMVNYKSVEGSDSQNRALYGLHEVANGLMMRSIPYDDLVELVYDLFALPLDSNSEKPRSFLQQAGDLCRAQREDCFARYIKYKVYDNWRSIHLDYDRQDQDPPWYIAIISDIRYANELEMIKSQPNHLTFKFTASPEELRRRIEDRDGMRMSEEQANHPTEAGIPDDEFDYVIDTTGMSMNDQVQMVYNRITTSDFEVQ